MIHSEHELAVSQRKLAEMQARAARLERSSVPLSDGARATLRTYRQWIAWLTEEISHFKNGSPPPRTRKFAIESEHQQAVTLQKLADMDALRLKLESEPSEPVRDASLAGVRRWCNRLREELAWYRIRTQAAVAMTAR